MNYEEFSAKLAALMADLPQPKGVEANLFFIEVLKDSLLLQKKVRDYYEGKLRELD